MKRTRLMSWCAGALSALTMIGITAGCGLQKEESGSGLAEAWDVLNDPMEMGDRYTYEFDKLPTSGQLSKIPWSDTYWPSNKGGIRWQWNGRTGLFGAFISPPLWRLRSMRQEQINNLSPAEKYDVLLGNYNYDLGRSERARTSPFESAWHGLCHGWAPAAMHFEEPKPLTVNAAGGITLTFGSADIKGLLSYYQGQVSDAAARAVGARCNADFRTNPEAVNTPECRDTNAGAFHVVLTNQIALMDQGFVADVTRDQQVWNQPVHTYKSTIVGRQAPSAGAAAGTVEEVVIKTSMTYTQEVDYPQWEALGDNSNHTTKTYEYRVELDENGTVIGGAWLGQDRPDFLWTQEKPQFTGYFEALERLYEASIAQ